MLDRGGALITFPGGDIEAMRPFRSRNTVNFNGRTGIVRLALERGVPVLPVAGSEVKLALLNGPIAAASVAALLVGVMAA